MRQADGAPDEKVREARDGEEPVEDGRTVGGKADVGEQAENQLDRHTPQRPALLVNVGQEPGGHALLGESLHGAGRAESARVGNADDGHGDDGVHDGREHLDAGILDGQDEGRRLGVGARRVQQPVVVGRQDQADDEEVDNVEEGDAPKHLLGGRRDGLARVGALGGGQADHLGAAEREGGNDEDAGKPVESVLKGAGVVPVLGTQVASVTDAAGVDDDAENNEARARRDLDGAEDEFN